MTVNKECIFSELQPTTDAIIMCTSRRCKAILQIIHVQKKLEPPAQT